MPRSSTSLHLELHALGAYIACMNRTQYTIRGVSAQVDAALRRKAEKEKVSLNEAALKVLAKGLGVAETPSEYHDLDELAGTWVDDPEFDKAIADMDQVDEGLWE